MASGAVTRSFTRTLAEFAAGVELRDAPAAVRDELNRVALDCLGCMVAGLVTQSGGIVVDLARGERGPLEAAVPGAGRASLLPAVLANVMLTNAIEHEVQGPEGHVCAVAAPVALAVAEAADAPGSDLAAGLLAGLEIGGRVGRALRRPARTSGGDGVHQHVVLAAAAAAGRALRLTPDQMHHALGIAGYGATVPTVAKLRQAGDGSMIKNSLGLMARHGVQAALLAQRGFTGDLEVLEGDIGFWRFAGAPGCDWDYLTRDLGSYWTAAEVWYKPTPSALAGVSTVQLLCRMVQEHHLVPGQIDEIEIRLPRPPRRAPSPEALNSTSFWGNQAYVAAAAISDVRPRRSWQDPETLRRRDLHELMGKMRFTELGREPALHLRGEEEATGSYEGGWSPVAVVIRANGQTFEGAQNYRDRMSDEELAAKFRENVAGLLTDADAQTIQQRCARLATLGNARELTESLSRAALP